jgi:hypothetical protein
MNTPYLNVFKDRTILITGVARSGTTILGNLLQTLKPTFYLYEPDILRPPFFNLTERAAERFRRIILEDYFLGPVKNIKMESDAKWKLRERITIDRPYFIIKQPNAQPYIEYYKKLFPGLKILHILRNGIDVVRSMIGLDWQCISTEMDFNMNNVIQPNKFKWQDDDRFPSWIEDTESKKQWYIWNRETRAAFLWRSLVEYSMKYDDDMDFINILHSDLSAFPEEFLKGLTDATGLKHSEHTAEVISEIRRFIPTHYDVILEKISQPELGRFIKRLDHLGFFKIDSDVFDQIVNA